MAAKLGDSEPGPSFSMDPEDHHRLSIELPTSRPVEQASLIMTAQERLRRLLTANRSIVQELSLPAVLRRIVETGRDVAGARYAALGVIGADGWLEQFCTWALTRSQCGQSVSFPKAAVCSGH
jgi:hypothetical protein